MVKQNPAVARYTEIIDGGSREGCNFREMSEAYQKRGKFYKSLGFEDLARKDFYWVNFTKTCRMPARDFDTARKCGYTAK